MKHFSAWQVRTGQLIDMIRESGEPSGARVWRFADGSYAVGYATEIDTDTEATDAGSVADWAELDNGRDYY